MDKLIEAMEGLLEHFDSQRCFHEETERLGSAWTHCLQCDRRWLDSAGGPAYVEPEPVKIARSALAATLNNTVLEEIVRKFKALTPQEREAELSAAGQSEWGHLLAPFFPAAPKAKEALVPGVPFKHVTPDCEDVGLLWAEIQHLHAAVRGPDGFATWQEAAVDERALRVKAERDANARLTAEIDALRADAERYQWLRQQDVWTTAYGGVQVVAGASPIGDD